MNRVFLQVAFLFVSFISFAGDPGFYLLDSISADKINPNDKRLLDSILNVYHQSKQDTDKVAALNFFIEQSQDETIWIRYNKFNENYINSRLKNGNLHERIRKRLKISLGNVLCNSGFHEIYIGEAKQALNYFLKALDVYTEVANKEGIANASNNLGYVYKSQGNLPKALEYYHQSLKINEEINNLTGLANILNNIGVIYKAQGDVQKAIEYYDRSLKIWIKLKDDAGAAGCLNNIGFIYNTSGQYDKALEYFRKSLALDEKSGDKVGMSIVYNNMGLAYERKKEYEKAIEYMSLGLKISEEVGNKKGISEALNALGGIYFHQNDYVKAKDYALRSFEIANRLGFPNNISTTADLLSTIFEKEGNYKKAIEMFRLSVSMRDSLRNAETEKAAVKLQLQYEYEKQQAIKDAEHKSEIQLAEEGKKRQKIISIASGSGVLLMIFFSVLLIKRNNVTRKQKAIIEIQKEKVDLAYDQVSEKNREILDSIRYAKRIQSALLKAEEHVSINLPEHFVFFRPKDIVSGDFYWSYERDNIWYVAASDCTGHGVPGAFLTMLGTAYLNEIVSSHHHPTPDVLLNRLREKVVRELGQGRDENSADLNIKDGMDISVVRFDLGKRLDKEIQIEWAGANNPLWIKRAGGEFEEIKADKQPIGAHPDPKPFACQTVKLYKGDIFYLFTDGFADQFGGDKGKKFKYKPLQSLLSKVSELPMGEQKQVIANAFEEWKNDYEQTDDVTLLAIRV